MTATIEPMHRWRLVKGGSARCTRCGKVDPSGLALRSKWRRSWWDRIEHRTVTRPDCKGEP